MKGKTGKTTRKLMPEPHGPMYMDKPMKRGGHVPGKACGGRADKRARGGKIKHKPSRG